MCFVPSESLLAAALEEDPSLLDYAFGKRVALASPVNLWAVLKTVAYTWTQQDVSQEARTLFELGNQLYERLGGLAGHADDLRRAIERTVDSYNRFAGSLESRVLVSARRFPGIDQTKLDALARARDRSRRRRAGSPRPSCSTRRSTLTDAPTAVADAGGRGIASTDCSTADLGDAARAHRDRDARRRSGQAPPGTKLSSAITAADTATKAPIIHQALISWPSSRRTRKQHIGPTRRVGRVRDDGDRAGLRRRAAHLCRTSKTPSASENTSASSSTPRSIVPEHPLADVVTNAVTTATRSQPHRSPSTPSIAVAYSHFETRCSETMRRSVPDAPRSTTLSV